MDMFQIVVLAVIQGLTEFLPISSSAHLILPQALLGWPDQGLAFDVAVHVGTLLAVVTYFRADIADLFVGWCKTLVGERVNPSGRLAWMIVVATIPAGLAGLVFGDFIEAHLRSMAVIAVATIIFGVALAIADKTGGGSRQLMSMTFILALVIGCAQALALVPGTSRSGITITAALLLGFSRHDAAKFSFLMSIPIIVLSGALTGWELVGQGQVDWFAMVLGAMISAVSAYVCIYCFLSFIQRLSMMPFVYYRLALGALLTYLVVA